LWTTHLELVGEVAVLALVADGALVGAGHVVDARGLRAAHEALRGVADLHLYGKKGAHVGKASYARVRSV
jgi:hypothetical protein